MASAIKAAVLAAKEGNRPTSKRHSDNAGTIPALLVDKAGRSRRMASGSRVMPSSLLAASIGQRRNSSPSATDARLAVQAMKSRREKNLNPNAAELGDGFSSKLTLTNPTGYDRAHPRMHEEDDQLEAGVARSSSVPRHQAPSIASSSRAQESGSNDLVQTMFSHIQDGSRADGRNEVSAGSSTSPRVRGANPPIWIRREGRHPSATSTRNPSSQMHPSESDRLNSSSSHVLRAGHALESRLSPSTSGNVQDFAMDNAATSNVRI